MARDRAHGVNHLLVARASFVAVLRAQEARGALGDVKFLGNGAQVGEVVQTDGPHEATLRCRAIWRERIWR